MKKDISIILKRIIDRKSIDFSLEKEKRNHKGSVVLIWKEDWHLFSQVSHPLVPTLEIQGSINIEDDFVRVVWFPHPTLITPDTRIEFFLFCNEANRALYSGGRFWCDEEFNFAYEIAIEEELIENCTEEAAKLLFDVPLSYFKDLHIPLVMLSNGTWKSNIATDFINELRTKGYVENSDYNL